MTNIIKFPRGAQPADPVAEELPPKAAPAAVKGRGAGVFARVVKVVWVATVLVWPLLKWLVSIDVFIQAIRMMYHWNTPGTYAGWTFLLHFAVLTALTYFVSIYKPKGI